MGEAKTHVTTQWCSVQ